MLILSYRNKKRRLQHLLFKRDMCVRVYIWVIPRSIGQTSRAYSAGNSEKKKEEEEEEEGDYSVAGRIR
jgi:hypothetical protein